MSTDTLNNLIRQKVETNLRKEMLALIKPLQEASRIRGISPRVSVLGNHPEQGIMRVTVDFFEVLAAATDHVIKEKLDNKTKQACEEFIRKVEGLHEKVDMLYDETYGV